MCVRKRRNKKEEEQECEFEGKINNDDNTLERGMAKRGR